MRELSHGLFSNIKDHQIETRRQYIDGNRIADSAQPNEPDCYCHLLCCPIIRRISRLCNTSAVNAMHKPALKRFALTAERAKQYTAH